MKVENIQKNESGKAQPRFSLSHIKEGLKELSKIRVEDLSQVSSEVLHDNIEGMLSAIRVLEDQLKDSTEVNAALRTEAKTRTSEILMLKRENEDLQQKLSALEKTNPLVGEVEKRLEIALEQIDEVKTRFNQQQRQIQDYSAKVEMLTQTLKKTEEERNDACKEIVVLMNKLEAETESESNGAAHE